MNLPVFENESPVGTLCISRQGLYTLFETRLPAACPSPSGGGGCGVSRPPQTKGASTPLTRLWLLDDGGAAAPLGLLEPTGEGRRLRRRLSRLDMSRLPPRPTRAVALPADERPAAPASGGGGCGVSCLPLRGRCPVAPSIARRHTGAVGVPQTEGVSVAAPPLSSPPQAAATPPPKGEARIAPWRSQPDGSLVNPERRLLALPWAGGEPPAPARKISLDGREYLVFRY